MRATSRFKYDHKSSSILVDSMILINHLKFELVAVMTNKEKKEKKYMVMSHKNSSIVLSTFEIARFRGHHFYM